VAEPSPNTDASRASDPLSGVADQLGPLQAITSALSRSLTPDEVAAVVIGLVLCCALGGGFGIYMSQQYGHAVGLAQGHAGRKPGKQTHDLPALHQFPPFLVQLSYFESFLDYRANESESRLCIYGLVSYINQR